MEHIILLSMILSCGFCQISEPPCSSSPCLNGGTCFNGADLTQFMCDCVVGYDGTNCEITLPGMCPSDFVCQNAGICRVTSGGSPFCECQFGFTGDKCQYTTQAESPCVDAICQNGGSCVPIDSHGYMCQCLDGFDGTTCETEIGPCLSSPCSNGGSCLVSSPDSGSYICSCPSTHHGANCEILSVNCASDPCRNGGTCLTPGSGVNVGFLCLCPDEYTGDRCERSFTVSSPCSSSPCVNNAMCLEIGENFTCSCLAGFKGNRCEINIDECSSSPCIHGNCVDVYNGFYCECETDWEGQTCDALSGSVVDPCASMPCANNGSCLPSSDMSTFLCICDLRFSGDLCETDETHATSSPDPCISAPCLHGGSCVSSVLPGISFVYCICQQGYVGQFCETEDGGACAVNQCVNGGTCNPHPFAPNGFFCTCLTDFSGDLCEVDERPPNPCESSPCTNDGTCFTEAFNNDYFCLCQIGYSGRHCEVVGPCVSQPCLNGATCLEEPHNNNQFMCNCAPGYIGMTCSDTVPEDVCSPNPCMNSGECMLTATNPPPGSPYISSTADFWCQCAPGYTGTYCQAVDPCISSPCLNGGSCSHVFTTVGIPQAPDGFWCLCTTGFIGTTCTERGPCESDPCMNGGTCIIHALTAFDPLYSGSFDSSMYSFICECPSGYTGETCSDIDLPEDNPCSSSPCENGGTCFAYLGGDTSLFYCQCPLEFVGDLCQERGPCESSPCSNGGTCFPTIINPTFSVFYCICTNDFTGNLCSEPISDPCSSSPCENEGSCSIIPLPYSDSTFMCSCPLEFTGERCESPIANPCNHSPCLNNGTCFQEFRDVFNGSAPAYVDTWVSYACQCPAGFTGEHCQVATVDACTSSPCQNLGSCTADGMMLFVCICMPGYTGLTCSEPYIPPMDPCQQEPCLNSGTCIVDQTSSAGYTCLCDVRYFGDQCQYQYGPPASPCDDLPCINGGTCITGFGDVYMCECPVGFSGVNCELDTSTDCLFDDNPYLNGDTRTDSCNTCTCNFGEWTCTEFICECTYGLDVYANGDHREEACNTCVCSNGQWFCTEMACVGQCTFMDDVFIQGDTRSVDCNICTCVDSDWICSDLKCHDDCKDDDQRYDDCNECFCKDGQWVCTTKKCSNGEFTNLQFSFPNDFNDIRGKEETFMRELERDLSFEFNIPTSLIQNMQVSAGSIVVNFDVLHEDDDDELDLDVLEYIEYSITSDTFIFTFEGVSYVPDPESFKMTSKTRTDTEEEVEDEIDIVIIAAGAGGALLIFAVVAIIIACFYKRRKVPTYSDSFKQNMEGIPNNTLSAKVQEPVHRVRTLPPGYKFSYNEHQ